MMQCAVILVALDLGKIESSGNFSNLRQFAVFSRKTRRRKRRKSVGNCPLVYLESGSLFVFWENDCCVLFVFNFRDSFPLEWPLIYTIDVESSPLLLYCFEEKSVPLDVLNKLHLIRTIFGSRILGQVSIHQSFLVLLLSWSPKTWGFISQRCSIFGPLMIIIISDFPAVFRHFHESVFNPNFDFSQICRWLQKSSFDVGFSNKWSSSRLPKDAIASNRRHVGTRLFFAPSILPHFFSKMHS